MIPLLNELVILFVVSVGIAYVCYRLKLVPIVGFLIAGVVIGPNALGLVHNLELVDTLAEIGIIFLMFTIGMEFDLGRLGRISKAIFMGGGLQVGVTAVVVMGILLAFGISWETGIYTGFLVAFGSTAIVLGLLSDEDKMDTPAGQLCLSVLIFQDMAAVVVILFIPFLSGQTEGGSNIFWMLGKAVIVIALVLVLARRIVPWILEQIAKTRRQEFFLLTVVTICFGTAMITNLAGVSLSLGAFLGGLVVSESNFREQAISEILPFRTIFTAVFFVSVGMLLDIHTFVQYPLLIIGTVIVILIIKFLINSGSLLALGYPTRIVAASGLAITQIGEFSFVLERAGSSAGLHPAGLGEPGSQIFIVISVILMIASPFLFKMGPKVGYKLSNTALGRWGEPAERFEASSSEASLEDHVIIVGYGPAGRHLVKVLSASSIPFVIIEMNPSSVQEMKEQQIPVIYGDASRPHILQKAAVKKAKVCVIATNDPRSTPRILNQARYINPTIQLIVRTRYLNKVSYLEQKGADIVVPEEMQTTVRLFSHVLHSYRVPQEQIDQYIEEVRADDYKMMRGKAKKPPILLQRLDDEGIHSRNVTVREDSRINGKTLGELNLRNRYGLSVIAVKRDDQTIGNPGADLRLEIDDQLVIIATADQFEACSQLFRDDEAPPED